MHAARRDHDVCIVGAVGQIAGELSRDSPAQRHQGKASGLKPFSQMPDQVVGDSQLAPAPSLLDATRPRFGAASGIGLLVHALNRGEPTKAHALLSAASADLAWEPSTTPSRLVELAIDGGIHASSDGSDSA